MKLSLYTTGKQSAAVNMAVDQALLELHAGGGIGPVLRIYGWDPPALTIGYSQAWGEHVDHDACARLGVPVIRRSTGGGAVLHDNEITYSLVASAAMVGENIQDSFRNVSRALIFALRVLGIDAEFAPLNDIVANGKKISGNAQVRHRGSVLQHGTILLGLDREKMFSLLNVSDEKLRRKQIARARDRVTCVEEEIGRRVDFPEAEAALVRGFQEWCGEELELFSTPESLAGLAEEIRRTRFESQDWNHKK